MKRFRRVTPISEEFQEVAALLNAHSIAIERTLEGMVGWPGFEKMGVDARLLIDDPEWTPPWEYREE